MDRSSKHKINEETQILNATLDEMYLIDIFRIFHPNAEEYTFSSADGTFSRIDHNLGHKSNLSKFKKIEMISDIFSDHNTMSEVKSLSRVQLFATPWTVVYQASLSMGFSRQEYWSGLPFPSPGDLPDPGIKPRSLALQADALSSEPPGKSPIL